MVYVKRIVLDVLKPRHPNGLEFAKTIADRCGDCRIRFSVAEVDDKTETVALIVEGEDLQFETISDAISAMGGSVHSIDGVEVLGCSSPDSTLRS